MAATPFKDDEEMFARVQQHDEDALGGLVRKYQSPLGNFSYSMLRCRDLADQAVANVFVNLWRRRQSIVIKTSVRNYLYAAAGNQSIRLWRKTRKNPTVLLHEASPADLIDARGTDTELLYRELREEIEKLLTKLPRQRQLVFRLSRIDGLAYSEIARKLSISEHTVQNHMAEASKQLVRESKLLLDAMRGKTARSSARAARRS